MRHKKKLNAGFSILEIVIALTILSILSYSILSGFLVSRDYDDYQKNRLQLEEVRKALSSFVQSNGFMPCPDTDFPPDGVSNRVANVAGAECDRWRGFLPFQTIGVKSEDVWGNPFFYGINRRADDIGVIEINNAGRPASFFSTQRQQLVDPAGNNTWLVPRFNLGTGLLPAPSVAGNLIICGEFANNCNAATPAADLLEDTTAIAVVISYGINGSEAWAGGLGFGAAELENIDNDRFFWQAQGDNREGQVFDDQLIWITGNDVKAAMLQTERGLR